MFYQALEVTNSDLDKFYKALDIHFQCLLSMNDDFQSNYSVSYCNSVSDNISMLSISVTHSVVIATDIFAILSTFLLVKNQEGG